MAERKENLKKQRVPSAVKRDHQSKRRRLQNRSIKSKLRTSLRSLKDTLTSGDKLKAQETLRTVFSIVDKGVKTGRLPKNKAARTKSRSALKVYGKSGKQSPSTSI